MLTLKIEDLPSKEPGKGEVRLKVEAIGLNRAESMVFHGRYLEEPQLPARLGFFVVSRRFLGV